MRGDEAAERHEMRAMHFPRTTRRLKARRALTIGALATVACVTLTSCSAGSSGGTAKENLVVQIQSGQEPTINAYIDLFKKQYPGVTVKTTSVSQTAKTGTNLQTITSSNAPDVAIVPTNSQAYTEATRGHQLLALTDVFAKADLEKRYGSALADSLKVGGTPYAVSFDSTFYDVVYYNPALFAKAGAAVPSNHRFASIDDLKAAVGKLKAKGYQGLSLGPADKFQSSWMIDAFLQTTTTPSQYQNYLSSWQAGEKVAVKFTDPPFVSAVAAIQNMGKAGVFQNGYLGMNVSQSEATFVQQRAAMLLDGSYTPPLLKKDGISFEYDWALLPPVDSDKQMKLVTYNGDAYAIPAKAKNPSMAKKFLETIMSPAGQSATVASGFLPSVNDLPKSTFSKLAPQVQSQLADVAKNGSAPGWTSVVPGGLGQQLVDPLVQEMLNGNGTPASIGQAAQAALEKFKATGH